MTSIATNKQHHHIPQPETKHRSTSGQCNAEKNSLIELHKSTDNWMQYTVEIPHFPTPMGQRMSQPTLVTFCQQAIIEYIRAENLLKL